MGGTIALISVVPAAMFAVNLMRRRWNGHLLLYASMTVYAYALNVINSMYSHYFLPLLVMLPVAFSAFCEDCADLAGKRVEWRKLLVFLAIGTAGLSVVVLLLPMFDFDAKQASELYSRIYNLPQKNPWRLTWPFVAVGAVVGLLAVAVRRGRAALVREGWLWGAVFFLAVSAAFAALPAAVIAPHIHQNPEVFYLPMAATLVIGCLFAYAAFAWPVAFADRRFVAATLAVPVLVSYLVLPTWRSAAVELVTKRTFYERDVAGELAKIVPSDAIVLGERCDQTFMSLPIRTVALFSFASNPVPAIEALLKRDPNVKLYGLFDSQHAYCLQNMQKCADKYRLALVRKFRMPSFGTGKLADVYLCKIVQTGDSAK